MIRKMEISGGDFSPLKKIMDSRMEQDTDKYLDSVREIIRDVRRNGDEALSALTLKYDRRRLTPGDFEVTPEETEKAYGKVKPEVLAAIRKAKDNVYRFHAMQMKKSWFIQDNGITLGQKVTAVDRAGVYVPGGTAAYPSSVMMNVLPAKVAGVKEIVMVTPPGGEEIKPEVLVAAAECGVDRIFRIGGAQAVAALAYGTETVPRTDVIVGPGNIYVALAKKMVYGDVGIDMIAGPSEILILADGRANPAWAAADMLSQAEHDVLASSVLITDSSELLEKTELELAKQLALLPRNEIAEASLRDYGLMVKVDSLEKDGPQAADIIAPEHLEVMTENPVRFLEKINHAGAIFLGDYTPEPVGDYIAGPNHVLPTGGTARFSSPLSVDVFLKTSSIISWSREALAENAAAITALAAEEGLDAHGNSIKARLDK